MSGPGFMHGARWLWLLPSLLFSLALRADPVVRIPVNDFPPWVVISEEKVDGVDVDLARDLLAYMGYEAQFMPCPWARCLKMLEFGHADMMLGLFRSPEREAFVKYVEPPYYMDPPKAFYTLAQTPLVIRSLDNLRSLTVGVIGGTLYFPDFDEADYLNKYEVTDNRVLINMLLRKRIDTFISTPVHIDLLAETMGVSEMIEKQHLDGAEASPSYMVTSRRSQYPQLHADLEKALTEWRESGRLQRRIETSLRRLHSLTQSVQNETN